MADNFTTPVSSGTVLATKDLAGVHIPKNALVDLAGADAMGEVQATPTSAYTLLGRLKAIADAVTTVAGHVDGLEALATTLNGLVDGLETLIGTSNTSLAALGGYVDGLEALATSLNGYVDGLETLQGTTNTTLSAISGYVDGLETLATALNGYVDGLEALAGVAATEATLAAASAKLPASLGAKAGSASLSVVPASDAVMPVVSFAALASANFSRPADTTAYASGDLVANSTTAGSVTPLSLSVARVAAGSGMIRRAQLRKSGTSLTNASFRLHLYTASPTLTNGDNGAWLSTVSGYIGSIDITVDKAFSDAAEGIGVPLAGSEINFALASGQTIYGLIEARAAYTPASGETFTVELEVLQN